MLVSASTQLTRQRPIACDVHLNCIAPPTPRFVYSEIERPGYINGSNWPSSTHAGFTNQTAHGLQRHRPIERHPPGIVALWVLIAWNLIRESRRRQKSTAAPPAAL